MEIAHSTTTELSFINKIIDFCLKSCAGTLSHAIRTLWSACISVDANQNLLCSYELCMEPGESKLSSLLRMSDFCTYMYMYLIKNFKNRDS